MAENTLDTVEQAFLTYDSDEVVRSIKGLLAKGVGAMVVVDALAEVLREIGDRYDKGELFLMHLVAVGQAAKTVLVEVLEPEIRKSGEARKTVGKVVIGTVAGDIHDIGKTIVATLLFMAGFEVYDLGVDVPVGMFIEKAKEIDADIIGLSALLSTTLPVQSEVIKAAKDAGIHGRTKIMVGGAPATMDWANEIGADGYAENGIQAVKLARKLMGFN